MVDESAEGGKWVRACVHAPVFIIDGDEVSKWLRNKIEMKVGAGVVILEQEKWTEGLLCLFSICPSLSPCGSSDGQALKQAGGPARKTLPCRRR